MVTATTRPRNLGPLQSAALLYGDWGTSKAYVIGLAFALAEYRSFWLIAAVSILIVLVGYNYITICKFSPSGGGVYASARRHSDVLALIGAFFLLADYLITAALSAISCFSYLEVAQPAYWAIGSIICIGIINYFGPRHSGNLALVIACATIFVVISLAIISLPYFKEAIDHIQAPESGFLSNWDQFVGIIVALSGIESIANSTGVMQLDPGATEENPSVHQTSRKAIIWVMIEVAFFTAFFGFIMNAIPNLTVENHQVLTEDGQSIRDSSLRYMGEYFITHFWDGQAFGYTFGSLIGIVFAFLLLSAVNTAIVALTSLLFVMSRDGEMPEIFQRLTPFGVPKYPLLLTVVGVIVILLMVQDIVSLANLYAVGFVGAIATNLGVNAGDQEILMTKNERKLMWCTFALLIAIEITLFITKPDARRFAISIMTVGLILRMLVIEHRQRQWANKRVTLRHASLFSDDTRSPLHEGAILCAVRNVGKTLQFAIEEAKQFHQALYILFVREQKVITAEDRNRAWVDDEDAAHIFEFAKNAAPDVNMKFFYAVSASPVNTIVDMAKELHVSRVILGKPRHSLMLQLLRGNLVQEVSETLSPEIDLVVIS